ncbi:MAG TPA: glycosyltransferase family 2 protein, partial [Acidobacteriota bacterium]|nr:glycosyltransferase family 2 protein [Acidobacteriota bacterium]
MSVSVIIPAFNEEDSIEAVLREIPRDIADEIIVVDNGSTDRTAERAASAAVKVISEQRRGYGHACLRGMSALQDPAVVVFLDGDHSDHPSEMRLLVQPIVDNQADLVIGSRARGVREKYALAPHARFGN